MKWGITRQNGYHGSRAQYTEKEVDYFAVYCIENDTLCLVPYDQTPKAELIIRTDNYAGNRIKTMKFASDFSFEKVINC